MLISGNRGARLVDSSTTCPPGQHHVGHHCFQYIQNLVKYPEAVNICQHNHGQLVTIPNEEKQADVDIFLGRMIRLKHPVWIGKC